MIWDFFFNVLDVFLDFVPVSICIVLSRFSSGIYYVLVLWALILHGFWHVGVPKLSFIAWYSLQNFVIFRGIWYFLAVRAVGPLILHGFLHVLVNDLSFFIFIFAKNLGLSMLFALFWCFGL